MHLPNWVQRWLVSEERWRRRAAVKQMVKLRATPPWADRRAMRLIYQEARRRSTASRRYVVDHIVPLRHPLVCGLHCQANLQILLEQENAHKSNLWWPDMPYEQFNLHFEIPDPSQKELFEKELFRHE